MPTSRYIHSFGAISALNYKNHSLPEGDSLTISCEHEIIKTAHKIPTGEVKLSNEELFTELSFNKCFDPTRSYTRTTLLALVAIKKVLENNGILDILKGKKIAIFNGTTAGGIDRSENFYFNYRDGKELDINDIIGHDPADSTIQIARFLERAGANVTYYSTISTACSSSAVAIEEGLRALEYEEDTDYVICGGVDPLSKFTINGFKSLGIYSEEICKPFDADRTGLNLGEGAAYLLIGREASKSLGEILSCESSSDAYHQTATSPEAIGPILAMEKAIKAAGISTSDIKYINAHGTATPNNDESEATAMLNIFDREVPPFSSTKCYTGHTLGASGAVEATLCIGFNNGEKYNIDLPTFSFEKADTKGVSPLASSSSIEKGCVMSNSFGFGGGGSSLVMNFGEQKGYKQTSSKRDSYITFISDNQDNTATIPANLRRRMSKMTKGGVAVALETNIEFDALHVALGLGSVSDTEKFLESVYSSNEELPNPTSFIQSTFNTLAGNITQIKHNHAPAITFVNRSLSLYNAIVEATWRINEGADNILIVAAEEGTDISNYALSLLNLKSISNKAYSFVVSAKPLSEMSAKIENCSKSNHSTLWVGNKDDLDDIESSTNSIAISEDLEGQMLHDAESLKIALDCMTNNATIVGSYAGQGKHYLHLCRNI